MTKHQLSVAGLRYFSFTLRTDIRGCRKSSRIDIGSCDLCFHETCALTRAGMVPEHLTLLMCRVKMVKIAIPVFQKRVSPVLDACCRLMVIEVKDAKAVERQEMLLDRFSLNDRFKLIQGAGIDVIICCGISDVLHNMLSSGEVRLICGIIGDVEQVLAAFLDNGLDDPSFRMPGYRETD